MTAADPGLVRQIVSGRWETMKLATASAVSNGDEATLLEALQQAGKDRRMVVTDALGRLPGTVGPGVERLRKLVRTDGPGTQDVRIAAVAALARRLGDDATPDLEYAVSQPSALLREYALMWLSALGDHRAFSVVLRAVQARAASAPVETRALRYLLRVCSRVATEERLALVATLRQRWKSLEREGSAEMVLRAWPEVAPGGPDDPGSPTVLEALELQGNDRMITRLEG